MICVILGAKKHDTRFAAAMRAALSAYFDLNAAPPELLLADWQSLPMPHAAHTVWVCKDWVAPPQKCDLFAARTVAIVNSANAVLLAHIAAIGLPAITCGFSARDTVTLSSMPHPHSTGAVVSFQRVVTRFDSSCAEPQEVPIPCLEASGGFSTAFAAMAAASICLMADRAFMPTKIASDNCTSGDYTSNTNR